MLLPLGLKPGDTVEQFLQLHREQVRWFSAVGVVRSIVAAEDELEFVQGAVG